MEAGKWLESIVLAILLIGSVITIALLIEATRGLIVLIIAAVWLLAFAIKKALGQNKEKK